MTGFFSKLKAALGLLGKAELGAPLVIVMVLSMLILPLPAFVLLLASRGLCPRRPKQSSSARLECLLALRKIHEEAP